MTVESRRRLLVIISCFYETHQPLPDEAFMVRLMNDYHSFIRWLMSDINIRDDVMSCIKYSKDLCILKSTKEK